MQPRLGTTDVEYKQVQREILGLCWSLTLIKGRNCVYFYVFLSTSNGISHSVKFCSLRTKCSL